MTNKIPKDWVSCSKCEKAYGFVNCRVTLSKGRVVRNLCLRCAIEEEKVIHRL